VAVSAPIVAGAAAAVALATQAVLWAQPRRAWRDAAEHRRAFWFAWDLAATAVGVGGLVVPGVGWAGVGWVTFWCLVGSAQPAMIADLRAVRRQLRRRRRARLLDALGFGAVPGPIRWQGSAPALDRSAALVAAGRRGALGG
jgi:hypothetical protein